MFPKLTCQKWESNEIWAKISSGVNLFKKWSIFSMSHQGKVVAFCEIRRFRRIHEYERMV